MALFILPRFVLVKYSCTFVAKYFLLGLATHYRESLKILFTYMLKFAVAI